jgi:hypothetical protein
MMADGLCRLVCVVFVFIWFLTYLTLRQGSLFFPSLPPYPRISSPYPCPCAEGKTIAPTSTECAYTDLGYMPKVAVNPSGTQSPHRDVVEDLSFLYLSTNVRASPISHRTS